MPSPGIPHRPSNRGSAKSPASKPKRLDLGDPLGPYDSNNVRAKVRKWQQQGGGVVIAPDVGASDDDADKSSKEGGGASETKRRERHDREDAKKTRTREPAEEKEKTANRRSVNAPKKRVVSDGHWRKDRTPAGSPTKTTTRKQPDVPHKYEQTKELFEKNDKQDGKSAKLDDDGIKVYAGPLRTPKSSQGAKFSDDSVRSKSPTEKKEKNIGPGDKKLAARRRSTRKEVRAKYVVNDFPYKSDNSRAHESSDAASFSGKENRMAPKKKTTVRNPKSPKGGIGNRDTVEPKTKFSKADLPPVQQSHGSKVEAWLSRTSDPFVDDDESLLEVPPPLKSSPRKRSESTVERGCDSDGIPSTLDERKGSPRANSKTSRKRQEIFSGTEEDNLSKESVSMRNDRSPDPSPSKSSPANLKRSKASKRPKSTEDRKMSMLRETVEEALQSTFTFDRPVSSDGSEVSYTERPPPLTLRRPFPGTGMHRLSTIASVDTLNTMTETVTGSQKQANISSTSLPRDDVSESEARDKFDPYSLPGPASSSLKRRLTNHADLISVLSLPAGGSRSIRSARSIRTNRSRLATATVGDIMRELASDEAKYMRELRTLVGGVIPVLLTSVLSKTDSAIAAGLFRPSAKPNDNDNFTRPIVNMGIGLEKLKSLHKRIPSDDPEALMSWALGAEKVYADYLASWRLGFQDVVVNLAPPDPEDASKGVNSDAQSLYAGMSQDENGDVVDGDGERVDVAFLLKRPLVRLKYLAKTFKGLNYIQPSPKTAELEKKYQTLVTDARRRANEERARLEDEAACHINANQARDIHTLAILKNVEVNQTRRVRARDFFDLSFLHSTGQQIDCRAELLYRDNAPENGPGGDLFICEIDDTGRWLLFPPIDHGRFSARNGDRKGEIVIMVRGVPEEGGNWHELLSLKTEDEQIGFEWVHILGLSPVPPKINKSLSFVNRAKQKKWPAPIDINRTESVVSTRSIIPSPTNIGAPFDEKDQKQRPEIDDDRTVSAVDSYVSRGSASLETSRTSTSPQKATDYNYDTPGTPIEDLTVRSPQSLNDAMEMAGGASPTTPLKRSKAKRRSKYGPLSPESPISSEGTRTPERDITRTVTSTEKDSRARRGESELLARSVSPELKDFRAMRRADKGAKRPIAEVTRLGRRSLSPVPSLELPSIPKLRRGTPKITPPSSPAPVEEPSLPSSKSKSPKQRKKKTEDPFLQSESNNEPVFTESVPIPPPHRSSSPSRSKDSPPSAKTPTFSPWARHRRTSSPLKHEYEPSTATQSTESETSTVERHTIYSSTETSDEELEDDDIATPLPPVAAQRVNKVSPPSSSPTLPEETLDPSSSASQAPYKTVPSQPSKASKTVASIYYWHDKGSWEALHADECRIMVTPGLIEAYEMDPTRSQSTPETNGDSSESDKDTPLGRPLIALELTPLVPIRRGTALDISIRSPPTEKSKLLFSGNNVMFRSRSPDECDKLYNFINQARINNPTYIALQNARGPYSNQPASFTRNNSMRSTKGSGWFSWYGGLSRGNSYRATSAPAPSVAGVTESSVGTMSSAFSALKRFGAGSKMFSIARSTLTSRTGSRGGSMYTTSTRSGSNPNHAWQSGNNKGQDASNLAMGGIGLTNAKIRLYCRESASKWRDMGAARLTILPASPAPSRPGTSSNSAPNSANENSADGTATVCPPTAGLAASRHLEKRILIHGKAHGQVLLDAVLGESCFERVARTGIAVSVWEEFQGVAAEGGVVGGSFKIYMIQMKSEAETAYTFGLVGKLRY